MKPMIIAVAALISLAIVPAHAGSILDAAKPANALLVEFSSPDTSPSHRLRAGQPLTVGVVVSRSTAPVEIVPTAKPDWVTYDAKTRQLSGVPVEGEHELSVGVTDVLQRRAEGFTMIKQTSLVIALAIGLLASSASAEDLNCVRATKAQSAEEAIALI